MKIEKEWRQALEDDFEKEKKRVSHLRIETQQITSLKKVSSVKVFINSHLKNELVDL